MYSTCLYCSRDFGANAVLETLPIGRRVAFDHDNGRLWVVCRACEKWNLVPFDTRLETIDACERLFHDAKLKYSTDHIGIARLPEGLELVRIGGAERHEFAAWRYGDQFGRRRRKGLLVSAGVIAGAGAMVAARIVVGHGAIPLIGISGVAGGQILQYSIQGASTLYQRRRIVANVEDADGKIVAMTPAQVRKSKLLVDHDGEMKLELTAFDHTRGGFATGWRERYLSLNGDRVLPALGKLLPRVNRSDGSKKEVQSAVNLMESDRSAASLLRSTSAAAADDSAFRRLLRARIGPTKIEFVPPGTPVPHVLRAISPTARLALEMLAHEESERSALAGELKLLERQWKDADKLAKIADELAVSDDVGDDIERMRESP